MTDDSTTTSEVIETLNDTLTTVEATESDLAGGVRAVVGEEDVGRMFGLLRREGFDYESRRDPSSDNVVFNIDAEDEEPTTIAELFGD